MHDLVQGISSSQCLPTGWNKPSNMLVQDASMWHMLRRSFTWQWSNLGLSLAGIFLPAHTNTALPLLTRETMSWQMINSLSVRACVECNEDMTWDHCDTTILNTARLGWGSALPKKDMVLWESNVGQSATQDKLEAETESVCGKALPWPSLAVCFNFVYDLFVLLEVFLKN